MLFFVVRILNMHVRLSRRRVIHSFIRSIIYRSFRSLICLFAHILCYCSLNILNIILLIININAAVVVVSCGLS